MSVFSSRRYLWLVFLIMLLPLLLGVVVNYHVDQWGVFSKTLQHFVFGSIPNRHFLKTRFILEEPHEHDCYLFGSSRVLAIDAQRLGPTCYNFGFPGSVPEHQLHMLRLMVREKIPIKRVYVGLDDISYTWNPAEAKQQYLRRGYPETLWDWLSFNAFYLIKPLKWRDLGSMAIILAGFEHIVDTPELIVDPSAEMAQRRLKAEGLLDASARQNQMIKGLKPTIWGKGRYVAEAIDRLQAMQALAEQHDFELVFFFNPHHYKTYVEKDLALMGRFKQGVAQVQAFYDFSGLNDVTRDNRYWTDTSHYSVLVGDAIAAVLLGKDSGFDSFEQTVDGEGITQHLAVQNWQMARGFKGLLDSGDRINFPATILPHLRKKTGSMHWQLSLEPGPAIESSADIELTVLDDGALKLRARKQGQQLIFNDLPLERAHYYLFSATVEVSRASQLHLYQEEVGHTLGTGNPVTVQLQPGFNQVYIPIYSEFLGTRLLMVLGRQPGILLVRKLEIEELLL